jgi:hypothetical protein
LFICCLQAAISSFQNFGWTGNFSVPDEATITAIASCICPCLCNFPYLTSLHLESIRNFPLSFFSACRHLESLTLAGCYLQNSDLDTSGSVHFIVEEAEDFRRRTMAKRHGGYQNNHDPCSSVINQPHSIPDKAQ